MDHKKRERTLPFPWPSKESQHRYPIHNSAAGLTVLDVVLYIKNNPILYTFVDGKTSTPTVLYIILEY